MENFYLKIYSLNEELNISLTYDVIEEYVGKGGILETVVLLQNQPNIKINKDKHLCSNPK